MSLVMGFAGLSEAVTATLVCACAVCRRDIFEGDKMGDHKVFKCGELSYIELAHHDCAVAENALGQRMLRQEPYWDVG